MEYITVNEKGALELVTEEYYRELNISTNSNVTIPLDDRYTLSIRNENNQIEFAILDGNDLITLRNEDTVMRVDNWAELLVEIRHEMGDVR